MAALTVPTVAVQAVKSKTTAYNVINLEHIA